MGSYIEINDTLQITTRQGFPKELNLKKHLINPYKTSSFKGKVFEFQNKPNLRLYHSPPVRVFFAQNINGKWIYWGQIEVLETTLNMVKKTTSGKYKIIKIFNPEEMKQAEKVLNSNKSLGYFTNKK